MKLAYLGYDQTVFKTYPALASCFSQIDSYLCDYEFRASDADFANMPIVAENVFVPSDPALQTAKHRAILRSIENEYALFRNNIYRREILQNEICAENPELAQNHFMLNDIIRLRFDSDNNKYIIEGRDKDPVQYDYLVVQNHQIVTEALYDHGHNIFSLLPLQANVLLSIDFLIERQRGVELLDSEYIYIANTQVKSIFDNWYICRFSGDRLRVSSLVPCVQAKGADYLEFITNRVRQNMVFAFETIKIKETVQSWVSATDGFELQSPKSIHPKYTAVFPSFAFWSQEKINYYVRHLFLDKNKSNRALFYGKEAK